MAMKPMDKYGIFRAEYDEVNNTLSTLVTRATFYISIESLLIGALSFKWDEILKYKDHVAVALLYGLTIFSFLVSLVQTIKAMKMMDYKDAFDFGDFENTAQTPKDRIMVSNKPDFLDKRIEELITASRHNDRENNKRARLLQSAGKYLKTGIILLFLFLVATFLFVNSADLETKQAPITLIASSAPSAKPVTSKLVIPSALKH